MLAFVRPHRRSIAGILGLTFAVAAANACEPLVMKLLFDRLGEGAVGTVLAAVGGLATIAIAREISNSIANWLTWRTRLGMHNALLDAVIERLHRLPRIGDDGEGVGGVMTRLDRGIQGIVGALGEVSFGILPSLTYLLFSIVAMFRLDARLACIVLLFAPLPALIAMFASPAQVSRERILLDRWAKLYSRFNEVLSGIVTVRSFAMEDAEKQRFLRGVGEANAIVVRGVAFDSRVGAAQNLAAAAGRIAAIGFGAWLVMQGEATLGTVVAFLAYINGLFAPVQGLSGTYKTLRNASVSVDTVFGILDSQQRLGDAADAVDAGPLVGEVEFRDVSFSYDVSDRPQLSQINLHAVPGEMIAVVGPSGAGKTTLMSLLQRFSDPTAGSVLIDGKDLRTLKQDSVRRQIGVVLQDAMLFNVSVRENIAYGRPDASLEEIIAAAQAANAHEFVSALPDGYETSVGERGNRLSAGERQRIAIARALLKNPPILILDEATSALDVELEALVQEALERLVRGRTTFVIAHRLSTVVNADRIVVLREGRIAEEGTHDELLDRREHYSAFVDRQVRSFIRPAAA
ncbi:MAG: ABC transporter ATP-binding protein/permease [Planctomycetota bacterium]|nr:ABC transporter ATP-binding protein/permease [Planctomycetota bacterium]